MFIYNTLEKFCILVAKGNSFVLKFLMKVSGLLSIPLQNFTVNNVYYTLETGETDIIAREQPKKLFNPFYEKHVESLCEEAIEQREYSFEAVNGILKKKEIIRVYNDSDPEDDLLKKKV